MQPRPDSQFNQLVTSIIESFDDNESAIFSKIKQGSKDNHLIWFYSITGDNELGKKSIAFIDGQISKSSNKTQFVTQLLAYAIESESLVIVNYILDNHKENIDLDLIVNNIDPSSQFQNTIIKALVYEEQYSTLKRILDDPNIKKPKEIIKDANNKTDLDAMIINQAPATILMSYIEKIPAEKINFCDQDKDGITTLEYIFYFGSNIVLDTFKEQITQQLIALKLKNPIQYEQLTKKIKELTTAESENILQKSQKILEKNAGDFSTHVNLPDEQKLINVLDREIGFHYNLRLAILYPEIPSDRSGLELVIENVLKRTAHSQDEHISIDARLHQKIKTHASQDLWFAGNNQKLLVQSDILEQYYSQDQVGLTKKQLIEKNLEEIRQSFESIFDSIEPSSSFTMSTSSTSIKGNQR